MTLDQQIEVILTNNVDCKISEYVSIENLGVKEYLQKLGTNKPKTRETAEICILFSEDLPQSIKDDHREFHDKMFNVLGAYDRYVHALYEVEGDNTELLSALNKLGAYGGDINDIMTIYERRTCLVVLEDLMILNILNIHFVINQILYLLVMKNLNTRNDILEEMN
ncbi:MAG: hypothetical protein CM15mP10_2440 [Actinomycetota bacterium]|nr:MAG: hypothetical protein CM15mP10_2440 [Actinomycetota bacterium]